MEPKFAIKGDTTMRLIIRLSCFAFTLACGGAVLAASLGSRTNAVHKDAGRDCKGRGTGSLVDFYRHDFYRHDGYYQHGRRRAPDAGKIRLPRRRDPDGIGGSSGQRSPLT
jgi:hypothetical protein